MLNSILLFCFSVFQYKRQAVQDATLKAVLFVDTNRKIIFVANASSLAYHDFVLRLQNSCHKIYTLAMVTTEYLLERNFWTAVMQIKNPILTELLKMITTVADKVKNLKHEIEHNLFSKMDFYIEKHIKRQNLCHKKDLLSLAETVNALQKENLLLKKRVDSLEHEKYD